MIFRPCPLIRNRPVIYIVCCRLKITTRHRDVIIHLTPIISRAFIKYTLITFLLPLVNYLCLYILCIKDMCNYINTLILCITAWLVHDGISYAQVSNPSGYLTPVQNEDIWAKTQKGNHFNEFWTYQFYLNNDLTVHITFSVANFGSLKSPVSGVQISVDRLNGEIYQLSREYDLDYLVQDRENLMFRNRDQRKLYFIGELPKEHRVRIHTSKDGVEYDIDLSMHNIQHGIKWDDGIYLIGDEKVGIYNHIRSEEHTSE